MPWAVPPRPLCVLFVQWAPPLPAQRRALCTWSRASRTHDAVTEPAFHVSQVTTASPPPPFWGRLLSLIVVSPYFCKRRAPCHLVSRRFRSLSLWLRLFSRAHPQHPRWARRGPPLSTFVTLCSTPGYTRSSCGLGRVAASPAASIDHRRRPSLARARQRRQSPLPRRLLLSRACPPAALRFTPYVVCIP